MGGLHFLGRSAGRIVPNEGLIFLQKTAYSDVGVFWRLHCMASVGAYFLLLYRLDDMPKASSLERTIILFHSASFVVGFK